jgi:uncharacterized membrane protein YidH (DUF202 family)
VEPKVALATERTFLSWLEFSIILGSIAATLINFNGPLDYTLDPGAPSMYSPSNSTSPPERHSKWTPNLISATGFTLVALVALIYSLALYLWRVDRIQKRMSVNYHDWIGPTGLCIGLFLAMLVSFGFRLFGWGKGVGLKG